MYIRRKVFSRIEDENGEVRLFSKEEAYGDIDRNAPDDPYYGNLINKVSKGTVIGGIGTSVAGGTMATIAERKGAAKGRKALNRIKELKGDIDSANFLSKDHFGHEGDGSFFDKQLKDNRRRAKNIIDKSNAEIKDILKKEGKSIKAAKLSRVGRRLVTTGGGLVTLGAGTYLVNKLINNSRRTSKKDLKDVLDQTTKK